MSMTYHDNEIKFTCGVPGKILSGGRYTISSFCVTKGQDPDGHIANGRVYTIPTRGSNRFIFNVGRKKSGLWQIGLIQTSLLSITPSRKKLTS